MTDITFVDVAGDVLTHDIDIAIRDGKAVVKVRVEHDIWEHIVREDIFGSRSRQTGPEALTGTGDVHLTLSGLESSLSSNGGPFAKDWTINDARRYMSTDDGAQAWQGLNFADAQQWSLAALALAEMGYFQDPTSAEPTVFIDSNNTSVVINAEIDSQLASLIFTVPLPDYHDVVVPELLVVLNQLNNKFPAGTLSYQPGRLILKAGLVKPADMEVPLILEALAYGLAGMTDMVAGTIRLVATGDMSAAHALDQLL